MSDTAIRIQGVGKRYRKGETTFQRESFKEAVLGIAGRWAPTNRSRPRPVDDSYFWALKGVSLDIKKGQILGLVGANGSGKSTLLKILARITKPTTGRIEIFGKVGSLLEVGTGFHPELTGRENVYLNGVILGMTRREIDKKFDTIVEFSGVEEFLDTPVKRYSSGMQVRLAFSVAAHLEPEILLLDEVLAVGDASFQKKSQGKMESVSRDGRTVILVSHSMQSIKSLCSVTAVLNRGELVFAGPTNEAVTEYLRILEGDQGIPRERQALQGVEIVHLKTVLNGEESHHLIPGVPLTAHMEVRTEICLAQARLDLVLEDNSGRCVIHHQTDFSQVCPSFDPGVYDVEATLPGLSLGSGSYYLWTRINGSSNGGVGHVASEKIRLEARGRAETLGVLDVPCLWSWRKKE
ncbi:MAG: ABC transporter ATP-binding protein [Pseudomonadota bacterium]